MIRHLAKQEIPVFIGFMTAGCCSNVYTFERLVKINSQITTLITFSQYLFIFIFAVLYLTYIKYWENNTKNKHIFQPQYFIPVLLQTFTSHLSNYVFQWGFTLPTHIIIRSSSTAITLILGALIWKKKYNLKKIIGSLLIAIGTIIFTIDIKNLQNGISTSNSGDSLIGIVILLLATVIHCMVLLYKEEVYQDKSNNLDWKGAMYYNNLYALMFYLPFSLTIHNEFNIMTGTMEKETNNNVLGLFAWNMITQLSCIIGVNILVFKISALSLTIVLLIRRFFSLFLSIYIFSTPLDLTGYCSVVVVITGALIYSVSDVEWIAP